MKVTNLVLVHHLELLGWRKALILKIPDIYSEMQASIYFCWTDESPKNFHHTFGACHFLFRKTVVVALVGWTSQRYFSLTFRLEHVNTSVLVMHVNTDRCCRCWQFGHFMHVGLWCAVTNICCCVIVQAYQMNAAILKVIFDSLSHDLDWNDSCHKNTIPISGICDELTDLTQEKSST